ncbi:MAG TPA: glycosyltransferase [Bryobacteraceae bacterium]
MNKPVELTVAIPALNEGPNLALLLPELQKVLESIGAQNEILIITRNADELTRDVAARAGARVLEQTQPGYGGALRTAFDNASGSYVLTMDADLSHLPTFIGDMWRERANADMIIASRYVPGGRADMPKTRYILSRTLNSFFRIGLNLPIRDLSSGFRLYRLSTIPKTSVRASNFDVLPELLVRSYAQGSRVKEIPFSYAPRQHGTSHARVLKFGIAYLRTFRSLWLLRNGKHTH